MYSGNDEQINVDIVWMEERVMDGWMMMAGWIMDGWMNEWVMDGWIMDGWMNG